MSKYELKAQLRTTSGKEKAKKLRAAGRFPAIIYGANQEPVSLELDVRETETVLSRIHGEKVLVDLAYGEKSDRVFVRNVQRDPVQDKLLHVDFFRVDLTKEIETSVPVIGIGTAEGVKLGGLLEHGIRQITVRCLPTKVPPHLEINVSNLGLNQAAHVSDLAPIEGVRIITPGEAVLFAVVSKAAEEPAPAAAGAAPAAPAAAGAKA